MSEIRIPWPSSTSSNPRSLISRNIVSPSVCRLEFQQVEKESMRWLGDDDRFRLGRGFGGRAHAGFAFLSSRGFKHEECPDAENDRGHGQSGAHSDKVGEARHE